MRRREFLTLFGGTAAAWPLAARAQRPVVPVIGYLYAGDPRTSSYLVAGFRKGLSETGFVEGRNVAIEFRWAENQIDRLPTLAAELIDRKVAVIVTPASSAAILAAKAATATIPIVFSTGADPVQAGYVTSLNQPSGNVTGITGMTYQIAPKRLGLLHQMLPSAARFALLVNNPESFDNASAITNLQAAAAVIGRKFDIVTTGRNFDIDTAFASLDQKRTDAILVSPDLINHRAQLITMAARYVLPAIYCFREDAEAGGLMSYGPSLTDNVRLVGIYAGRILKGEKPAVLPVMQTVKFEFVINLTVARALQLDVPAELLVLADDVLE
jgi:putative tryptophan/tyrosine transport system substrate-binding protein